MNKLNMKEFEETFKARLIERNKPLFDLLNDLDNRFPLPAIDFDPEDGGVEFVWVYNSMSISIYMEKESSKYGIDYKPAWTVVLADHNKCNHGYYPTAAFIEGALMYMFGE